MKIVLIQMNSGPDKEVNLQTAQKLVAQAIRAEQPDWICLPEVWTSMGGTRKDKLAAAEIFPDGAAYQLMQRLACEHHVFIHAGSMLERREGEEKFGNTSVAFNREGIEVARYRKIHLFDVTTPGGQQYTESAYLTPGKDIVTYQCDDFLIGCAICYDLRFPYLFQKLMEKDVDLIALPAAFTQQTGQAHWDVLTRARAIETQTYLCAAAQTGAFPFGKGQRHTYGHSTIIDPWGAILAQASTDTGYISAKLEKTRLQEVRKLIPLAQHKIQL